MKLSRVSLGEISLERIFDVLSSLIVLWLSGFSAFLVGAAFALEGAILAIFSERTLLFLSYRMNFLGLLAAIVFNLSDPLIRGLYFVYLPARLRYKARKRGVSLKSALMERYHLHMIRAFQSSSKSRTIALAGRGFLGVFGSYWLLVGFSSAHLIHGKTFTYFISLTFGVMVLGVTVPFWAQAPSNDHDENIFVRFLSDGRAKWVGLVFCSMMGFLYIPGLAGKSPVEYQTTAGKCEIAAMFPVFGGDLYFDQLSRSFLVLRQDGREMYILTKRSLGPPECVAHK